MPKPDNKPKRSASRKQSKPDGARAQQPRELPQGIGRDHPLWLKIKQAERGAKLAEFDQFALVEFVWKFTNDPPPTTGNLKLDEQLRRDWALPRHKAQLRRKLLEAVVRGDYQLLRNAADTVEWLHLGLANPRRLDQALLIYFRSHESRTIEELMAWLSERMGWNFRVTDDYHTRDKQVRRRCKSLRLKITPSKPGPKAKR